MGAEGMKAEEGKKLLDLAESAALLAGARLKDLREDWRGVKSEAGHDIKVEADRLSEDLILERLSFSGIPLFCEETGAVRARAGSGGETPLVWVVDPLDGTLNYRQGIPLSCVSIALCDDTRPVLGVVYDFNHGELFSGLAGSGAWLNHRPIRTSGVTEVSKAVLCTGFPVNTDFSTPGVARFVESVQRFRKVRLLGSAALSLCYVACGRADAYRESRIMFWDVAAGLALVQAAGGGIEVGDLEHLGSPVDVTATNGVLDIPAG
jgi:myo-inositol-1(or 4)-monophosphatase